VTATELVLLAEAMRALQGKTLLVEGQLERLEQLLNEVTNLHTIRKRAEIDPATGTAPLSAGVPLPGKN
jgi:hypothetical protein